MKVRLYTELVKADLVPVAQKDGEEPKVAELKLVEERQFAVAADPAIPAHRDRQYHFQMLARRTPEYETALVIRCTRCHVPRACISSCCIFFDSVTRKWEAYCICCSEHVNRQNAALTARYDDVRCATWFAQFGATSNGECCACGSSLDFWSFHRAHDSNSVQSKLKNVVSRPIHSAPRSFAARLKDGSVVVWGAAYNVGTSMRRNVA